MANLLNNRLVQFVFTAVVVWFAVFNLYALTAGIPLGYLYGNLPVLAVVQSRFSVSVSPSTPVFVGQNVIVSVSDSDSLQPVEGATVSISKNSNHLVDLTTDSNGHASFEYPGETTIIVVSKPFYTSLMKVIPHVPDAWLRDTSNAWISGVVTGVLSGILEDKLRSRVKRSKKPKGQKRLKTKRSQRQIV